MIVLNGIPTLRSTPTVLKGGRAVVEIREHSCANHELLYIEPVACGQTGESRGMGPDVDDPRRVRPVPPTLTPAWELANSLA
jgi:hypothetical protein